MYNHSLCLTSFTELYEELDGQNYVIEFDFLGKDSIRYYNKVTVDPQVFKNVKLFMKSKEQEDDLFDRLNVSIASAYYFINYLPIPYCGVCHNRVFVKTLCGSPGFNP